MLIPLPERLHAIAEATKAGPAPVATPSATIAVTRPGENGLEVFLMRRQRSMAFAAGMYVFPGGGLDREDEARLPWVGPEPDYFAERFGCTTAEARALVVTAARETFEETGVLMAGPDEHSLVSDAGEYHDARARLERREFTFAEFLERHSLALRADLLWPWAHWITPAFQPRRFDTRFFVAVLPEGQQIDSVSGEADRSLWLPAAEAVAAFDRGEADMLTPTITVCRELAEQQTESLQRAAAVRQISPIEPVLVERDGQFWLELEKEEHL